MSPDDSITEEKEAPGLVLDELGTTDEVDRDIVLELAGKRPLGYPERSTAIGRCGAPPKDQSTQFALIAMILLGISWILLPFAFIGIIFE